MPEHPTSTLSRNALAYVLAGGRGSRLLELTDRRAKPAVFFGGKSRIIDFALIERAELGHPPDRRRDAVQGAQPDPPPAARLELLPPERNESFDILPASQRVAETSGTRAPPTRSIQNIDIIESTAPTTS